MKLIRMLFYITGGTLAASLLFMVTSFAYSSIETISAQSTMSRLEELHGEIEKKESTQKEWLQIEDTYGLFKSTYLMNTAELGSFKQRLQVLANQNALLGYKTETHIQTLPMDKDIIRYIVRVEAMGDYRSFKKFLYELEKRKEILLFREFKLEKDRRNPMLKGTIEMEVYFVQ